MTRFLVTGATGFIGSAVVRRLTAEGHEIVAWRGRSDPIDLLTARDVEVARLAGDSDATHCIHCAWYTNHADYLVHDVNREWLKASLRLARACGDMRFVGLGTCLEYDLSAGEPCVEDESPLTPQTLYARCKRDLFEVLGEIGGDFAWARVFFVYGPGDRAGRLIPSMIERFRRGEAAAPTYGGLRRDYIHVDDLAAQIVRIATSEVSGAINTGTGEAPSLSEIFEAGGRAFGRPELAQANDNTGDQPWLIQGDLARFRDKIGEVQARDIAAGLMDMVR